MKNKLIVMILTFAVMIVLTPLVFSKLMNAKFNQMIKNLNNKGIKVEVIKDKSSYLQTDKILNVEIPKKYLNNTFEKVNLEVEAKFKNLPVTNVLFLGNVKNVKLMPQFAKYENEINKFVKKYIKFTVITPNFKDYTYKINDIDIQDKLNVGVKDIKGMFKYSTPLKNVLNISDIYLKQNAQFVEIKNLKSEFEGNKNKSFSKTTFNVNVDLKKFKLQARNVYSKTNVLLEKTLDLSTVFGFDELIVPNMLSAKQFKNTLSLKGIKASILEKLSNASENEKEKYYNEIFKNGFEINLDSNLKDLLALGKNFGKFNLKLFVKFLPTNNYKQKLKNNNFDFIYATLDLTTTPQIANIIMNLYPKSAFLFALAKKQNGVVKLNLELKNGKLYSEGQLIK